MSDRPPIPAALERQVMIDAGWRCSIPGCSTNAALEIDHIVDWAKRRVHEYENLIVLCPTHHAMKRKGSHARDINAASLKVIKANQMELAGRFGDVERRILEHFVRNPEERIVFLPGDFDILLMQLLDAGILTRAGDDPSVSGLVGVALPGDYGDEEPPMIILRGAYLLSGSGVEYVSAIRDARELP